MQVDEKEDRRQKIRDERDALLEFVKGSARWRELVKLPELEHFCHIRPLWYVCWIRRECEVPGPIAGVIESDYARKKTSIDIPASPALRFGRCSIDFTVGKHGQITLQQDSARENRYGCVAQPPSGTYLLRRAERDESGNYFGSCVNYFFALFNYLAKKHQLAEGAADAQTRAAVAEGKAECKALFKEMHLRYSKALLTYKFTSSASERIFYEFLYYSTMRMLRRFIVAPKLHGM